MYPKFPVGTKFEKFEKYDKLVKIRSYEIKGYYDKEKLVDILLEDRHPKTNKVIYSDRFDHPYSVFQEWLRIFESSEWIRIDVPPICLLCSSEINEGIICPNCLEEIYD